MVETIKAKEEAEAVLIESYMPAQAKLTGKRVDGKAMSEKVRSRLI